MRYNLLLATALVVGLSTGAQAAPLLSLSIFYNGALFDAFTGLSPNINDANFFLDTLSSVSVTTSWDPTQGFIGSIHYIESEDIDHTNKSLHVVMTVTDQSSLGFQNVHSKIDYKPTTISDPNTSTEVANFIDPNEVPFGFIPISADITFGGSAPGGLDDFYPYTGEYGLLEDFKINTTFITDLTVTDQVVGSDPITTAAPEPSTLVSVRRLPESFESVGRRRRNRLNRLDWL
jgi:hypothetical protein